MEYLVVKWLHVLSSTVLFGAGVGSAFHLFAATLQRHTGAVAGATRNVVIADWLLTLPTAIFQPLSGLWLVHLMHVPVSTPWIAWSLALYAVAMACWIPVVFIQFRLRDHAARALASDSGLSPSYRKLFAAWVILGFGGLFSFAAIFWLMVAKHVPFA
jgi:uncharacterized membrane protein